MNERMMQFRVGVMVLATLIITAILVVMFNEPRAMFGGKYTLWIEFPQAPGVTEDTPIRKSGILIGRVSRVDLAPDGGAIIAAKIDANRRLRHNEVFRIVTSVLGDATVEVVPSRDPRAPGTFIKADERLRGEVAEDPLQVIANLEGGLSKAIGSVGETSEDLGKVVCKIGNMLDKNEERINNLVVETERTVKAARQVVESTNELVSDPQVREQLKQSIAELPEVLKDIHQTINRMNDTVALVEKNLQNMEDFTRPLGQRGEVLVDRIDQGTRKLDLLMDEMLSFSRALNDQEGTLGQLVRNPELYQRLNRAAKNIDEITRQLKPIVRDARIFSDKIARHPGIIVRDAVRPGPGTKW